MKILHGITLFATLGLALAKQFFVNLGIEADYATIGALGLAVTTMLVFRSWFTIIAVAILVLLVMFNPEFLAQWHLDNDILLAAALTIVLLPWLNRLIRD